VVIAAPKRPIHPALVELGEERARSVQNRVADSITRFAGSMWFAYLNIAWFSIWIALGVERYPYGLLTMIVSLEAIFLSTFVIISQNRQDDVRRHLADQEWRMVQSEERQNVELIGLSNQILDLTSDQSDPRADAGAHGGRPPSAIRPEVTKERVLHHLHDPRQGLVLPKLRQGGFRRALGCPGYRGVRHRRKREHRPELGGIDGRGVRFVMRLVPSWVGPEQEH
jgi:hypothetical protein